uniref:Uncharacterized protein n=1 Tax=Rhizophora mucronata TaxID=61149 RepID=A0A2P2P1X3_RHIMU
MALKACLKPFELLLHVGVPVVFYVIICSLRKIGSYGSPSIAKKGLEVDYHLLLLLRKITPFDPWPQVISPSKPATLTAPEQPCVIRHCPPIPGTMFLNI